MFDCAIAGLLAMTRITNPNLSTTVAKIYSLHNAPPSAKIVHLVRHAQGIHNISPDLNSPDLMDAYLTPTGIEQCRQLSQRVGSLDVDCIISSPMTRCVQTALHSFAPILSTVSPVIAQEEWRETVNFICDKRRSTTEKRKAFPNVDFSHVTKETDEIWDYYEKKLGSVSEYGGERESGDGPRLSTRAREALNVVLKRPEKSIAVVSHAAFLQRIFAPENDEVAKLVVYQDDDVKSLMSNEFANCELRSVGFEQM